MGFNELQPMPTVKQTKKSKGAKTPEGKVKQAIKEILNSHGAYTVMPATWGMGSSGVPDFLVCYNGRFIAIEAKSNKTTHPVTKLQQRNLDLIKRAGGEAYVIDEESLDNLYEILGVQ